MGLEGAVRSDKKISPAVGAMSGVSQPHDRHGEWSGYHILTPNSSRSNDIVAKTISGIYREAAG